MTKAPKSLKRLRQYAQGMYKAQLLVIIRETGIVDHAGLFSSVKRNE